jgi:hypothetical protein
MVQNAYESVMGGQDHIGNFSVKYLSFGGYYGAM